ncbi:unnamed protein product [Urochloa humidicola]
MRINLQLNESGGAGRVLCFFVCIRWSRKVLPRHRCIAVSAKGGMDEWSCSFEHKMDGFKELMHTGAVEKASYGNSSLADIVGRVDDQE